MKKEQLEKLIKILACPKCKGDLKFENRSFICYVCRLKYPFKNDIPVLLVEEAEKIEVENNSYEK